MREAKPGTFTTRRNLGAAKAKELDVIQDFVLGYRNREDPSFLKPQTLVVGSQNVLSDVSGRIKPRKGYTVDGATSSVVSPIKSPFDWPTHTGFVRHLRAGFLTFAANDGKLQFRFVSSAGTVTWMDLMTGLTSVDFNYTDYWDSTQLQAYLLMVNNTSNIYEWSGGITTIASATANTITTADTKTWAQLGFYNAGTRSVTINGTVYAYTGGEGTLTLTGVTPSPAAEAANSVAFQTVRTTANSAMTALPTQNNALIANLRNQIYVASLTSNSIYVSKVNNYKDYSFTIAARLVGEGAIVTLDGSATAMIPQEDSMYISAGRDQWYITKFTLSSDNAKEDFAVTRLKTTSGQGAISQGATTKIKNDIAYVSYEPIINTLGRVDNILGTPQITDLSAPIVNDINAYDLTGASCFYFKQFLYISIPQNGIVRVFNMTNPQNPYWEAPLLMPLSGFSNIEGVLYGHSFNVSESYKLFDGYADRATTPANGSPIYAIAKFAYQNDGLRFKSKSFNKFAIEGYMSSNTVLSVGLNYNLDGCATTQTINLVGTASYVCNQNQDNSLGKFSLGKSPLGTDPVITEAEALPPNFRIISTFPRVPYYLYQPTFSSSGISQRWELLAFGTNTAPTSEGENAITV